MKVNIKLNIEKKYFFIILAVVLLIGAGVFAYTYSSQIPNPGHGGDTVWVSVNGSEMTLQDAITDGRLGNGSGSGISIIGAQDGYAGMTGTEACAAIGKTCNKVISYNFIRDDAGCSLPGHSISNCNHLCAIWYNQPLTGVTGGGQNDNIHDCSAKLGEYTTYLESSVVRCNAFFSAVCSSSGGVQEAISIPCTWSGELAVYGNGGGCEDDVYINCTAGKVVSMHGKCTT